MKSSSYFYLLAALAGLCLLAQEPPVTVKTSQNYRCDYQGMQASASRFDFQVSEYLRECQQQLSDKRRAINAKQL